MPPSCPTLLVAGRDKVGAVEKRGRGIFVGLTAGALGFELGLPPEAPSHIDSLRSRARRSSTVSNSEGPCRTYIWSYTSVIDLSIAKPLAMMNLPSVSTISSTEPHGLSCHGAARVSDVASIFSRKTRGCNFSVGGSSASASVVMAVAAAALLVAGGFSAMD